jgi:DsbC/DsbD-like thiol-disulfide interchange protein
MRAAARARGTDRATAVTVGRALLAQPLPAQLTQVRCEKLGVHRICGLVVSGVKFKHPLDRPAFLAEVRQLIEGAFAHAPQALEEVDLWTTVPLEAGKGVVVSGDLAAATSATVFAVTVPRAALARLKAQLESGRDVYWDSAFADSLAKGT